MDLGPLIDKAIGIDVSADGRWLVYSRADSVQSEHHAGGELSLRPGVTARDARNHVGENATAGGEVASAHYAAAAEV